MSLKLMFLILIIFLVEIAQSNDKKVKVTILYETYCPDSRRFINQLTENYEKLKNKIDVEFVPFGKASVSVIFFANLYNKISI